MEIRDALATLDGMTDDHWTQNGEPRLDVLSQMVGRTVTRQEVVDAAPKFSRSTMELEGEAEAEVEAQEGGESEFLEKLRDMADQPPIGERKFIELVSSAPNEALKVIEDVCKAQIEACNAAVQQANEMKAAAKRNLQIIRRDMSVRVPEPSEQSAISDYLKSQQELRAAKVAATREILKGIDPKELDPRAAIDRAMARKTARGGKRPTRV